MPRFNPVFASWRGCLAAGRCARAALALGIALGCAAAPSSAAAANGRALADMAQWIHRMHADCRRAAADRCLLLASEEARRRDAQPRAARAAVEYRTSCPESAPQPVLPRVAGGASDRLRRKFRGTGGRTGETA